MTARKLRAYEYILCQAFQAIPRETGAYFDILHTLLCRSIMLRLLIFSLCYAVLRFIMKRQQKLSVFFKQKRKTVEDGEAEEVSLTLSQPPELQEPKALSSRSTVRKFRPAWKNVYPWLQYDEEKRMSCSICVKHQKNNAFTKGTNNFRSSMLERHVAHDDHADALRADAMQGEFQRAVIRKHEMKKVFGVFWHFLFRIGLSFFKITIQYDYLTVNCNKQIKTVIVWMMSVFSKFQYHSLTQAIFEMTRIKMSCGTNDLLGLNSRLNTDYNDNSNS